MRSRSILVVLSIATAAVLPVAGSSAAVDDSTRLYLLASDQDFLYWSPDPGDPEAAALVARRSCAGANPTGLCAGASPTGYYLTIPFLPAAVHQGPIEWGSDRPARFHLQLDIDSTTPATVHAIASSGAGFHESAAATEVSPGVFEGTIATGHRVKPGDILGLAIRVRVPAEARAKVAVEVGAAGQSWIEFPGQIPMTAVPEMVARSTYAPEPNAYATPDRSFRFNDRDWEAFTFTGNLNEPKTFSVPLGRRAAVVVGWIEGFSKPVVHGLLNGDPGARSPLDTAFVRLATAGGDLSRHRYSASAIDVLPGSLEMHVEPIAEAGERPYRGHLVVIYGLRTLAAMRWRFEVPARQHQLPNSSSCAVPLEQVPATKEVTTFRVDLKGTSPSPLPQNWALVFDVPDFVGSGFCNVLGGGGGVRFAIGGARVALVGPAPSPTAVTISAYDTEFEAEVRYSYTPV